MSRKYLIIAAAALTAAACSEPSTSPDASPRSPLFSNGFPDNGHATMYKMNLIGHPGEPSAQMLNDAGKRIFVRLEGNTRILLSAGDFDITDANGTDGTAAFTLPDPDPDNDGVTTYGVYVRPKGKPGKSMNITTCATADWDYDPSTPVEELCSLETAVLVRGTGKPQVKNVSKELLTACIDTNDDSVCDERIFLFDSRASDYLWSVDNYGLRNAEVRFIEIPQNIGLTP